MTLNCEGRLGGHRLPGPGDREPEWLTVKTSMLGMKETFVPLALARTRGPGEVELAADKYTITSAPKIDTDGELSLDEEQQLYSYYGQRYGGWGGLPEASGQTTAGRLRCAGRADYDTSGPTTDEAMPRRARRTWCSSPAT